MNEYNDFAAVYERFSAEEDYAATTRYFVSLLREYGNISAEKPILLDLACGAGRVSRETAKLGYDVIGVDGSADMLSIAIRQPHDGITYLRQDMRKLDLYGTVEYTLCAGDGINHITEVLDLLECFQRVRLFTVQGGVFVFDYNTIYKHEKILADNVFVFDDGEYYLVWKNCATERKGETEIRLDMFIKKGDSYIKKEDSFFERAYTCPRIVTLLKKAGFSKVFCMKNGTDEHVSMAEEPQCDKVAFVAVA